MPKKLSRRQALQGTAGATAATLLGCRPSDQRTEPQPQATGAPAMPPSIPETPAPPVVQELLSLGHIWTTADPFLFCVHHDDAYPAGNAALGVEPEQLAGRRRGSDFSGQDGWSMYHGEVMPGFPSHPHRGFETVTVARRGYIDHSDSMGARARYGDGDVQWMTAGKGVVHAEMFPLVRDTENNPVELFQIWLNLPQANKMVDPYFTMFWNQDIPRRSFEDAAGKTTEIKIIAGNLDGATPLSPPPDSWAARPEAAVAIWVLKLAPGAHFSLPPATQEVPINRTLYMVSGDGVDIDGHRLALRQGARLDAHQAAPLQNGDSETELLLLQGRPIGETVAQHGPFVMNTRAELAQAYEDYRRTRFGGWPWDRTDPVHGKEQGRFAQHADGRLEEA